MAPKRLISGENKESGESASVSEPQPSTSGFTEITPGEKLQDIFMDDERCTKVFVRGYMLQGAC
ncbi:hypothetical protein E2C01_045837 [Portunus trituberculatus]|uniref:Uncharacterized protein n=1 Tax=Portunus trituberculatus TaxID=210409 RepID=A0A5B7G471_PORTR|nr:hypothetical protein [Portunus trituberculatus]